MFDKNILSDEIVWWQHCIQEVSVHGNGGLLIITDNACFYNVDVLPWWLGLVSISAGRSKSISKITATRRRMKMQFSFGLHDTFKWKPHYQNMLQGVQHYYTPMVPNVDLLKYREELW